ncbi:MAG: hypothetical protein D6707_01020, partial [Bacteroidetes bacterium]
MVGLLSKLRIYNQDFLKLALSNDTAGQQALNSNAGQMFLFDIHNKDLGFSFSHSSVRIRLDMIISNFPFWRVKFGAGRYSKDFLESFAVFGRSVDLSVYFLEKSFSVLRDDGIVCSIVNASLFASYYGIKTLQILMKFYRYLFLIKKFLITESGGVGWHLGIFCGIKTNRGDLWTNFRYIDSLNFNDLDNRINWGISHRDVLLYGLSGLEESLG